MAKLLLLDTVSWSHSESEASACSSLLSSISRPDHHHSKQTSSIIRCASTEQLLDRLDPQLPRLPNHKFVSRETTSRTRNTKLILDTTLRSESSHYNHGHDVITKTQPPSPGNNKDLEQPPSPGKNKDVSVPPTSIKNGKEVDLKQRYDVSPYYLSLSQSSRKAMRNGVTIQLTPNPLQMKQLNRASSVYMGFATIALGLVIVFKKSGLLGYGSNPTVICAKCDGYGITRCNLCKGKGGVTWEGKLTHVDPCPLCFGSRTIKCQDCGGARMRKDTPPVLQAKSNPRMAIKLPFLSSQ